MTQVNDPVMMASPIPITDEPAGLTKEDRRSAQAISDWIETHYKGGQSLRKPHAVSWIRVKSIMRGIHYFRITKSGMWVPLKKKDQGDPRNLRAVVPLMRPMFKNELGRINANSIGVTTTPASGGSSAIHKADRAYHILTHWTREADVLDFFDRANQILLYEGMVGYYRYVDPLRQGVFMRPLAASELFPIPYDAKDPAELDGIMHVTVVTEQWLEQQDALFEAQTGRPPARRMADMADDINTTLSMDFPSLGSGPSSGGKIRGAVAKTIWMKSSPSNPGGLYMFKVNDTLFRFKGGTDPQTGESLALPNGKIPIELVYYHKQPDDFWGYGYCEELIGAQLSMNRQMTNIERNVALNRPYTLYDADAIEAKDIQNEPDALIPFHSTSMGPNGKQALTHIPAQSVGNEAGALLGVIQQQADMAAGLRSPVLFGQSVGRIEGSEAISQLNANAQSPLVPVLNRIYRAWEKTYPEVLDMLHTVWPLAKTIKVSGTNNVGKEIIVRREDLPASTDVIIRPTPLLPAGTQTLANILFQLKTVPGEDGTNGSLVPNSKFLESLRSMDLLPPSLHTDDDPGARIQNRISALVNDGQKTLIPTAYQDARQKLEDHNLFVDLLRKAILHDSFTTYSPEVQNALKEEFQFHFEMTQQGTVRPVSIDSGTQEFDSRSMEDMFDALETHAGGL